LDPKSREAEDWKLLGTHLKELCDRYAKELGENAYAVLNAVTEFASHPPSNPCVHRERHSFQRLAGTWLSTFGQECRKPGFVLAKYIEQAAKPNGNAKTTTEATATRHV
jgi:hypothetical protein